ncbi:hypothetical protein B296_00026035 [Ensete ventricosum]|uniref:Uncharacterized protein n=1 Tax=Ensete ventricosum TaxID=4639 RepID=A0A426YCP4_ENSVE|nr:hypothetical protein B296_00026035 [Ensete ventricosum]
MVPQRRVFRVCASNLASNEILGYQHMGVAYHGGRILSASTRESHGGDLIIQRYDQSDWRVGLLQCLYSFKGARQVRGQGRVLERDEEAMTNPKGLSYPKEKRRLERRWTRRSATRRDFRGVIDPLLSWRESIGRKRGRGDGECRGKLQVPRQGGRAKAKELHKTSVDGLLIKIVESERLRADTGVLDQGTK